MPSIFVEYAGLILLAVVSPTHLRGEAAVPGQQSPKAAPAERPPRTSRISSFTFSAQTGSRLRRPLSTFARIPAPTAEQIRHGKFLRQGSYGAFLMADGDGRLVIDLPQVPQVPKSLDVDITTPGYGPYWASWSSENHDEVIPSTFTAELEAGWSVGGIIVDPDGKPVEGVTVTPSIEFKKRPGDLRQLGIGARAKTDAAGKWRFDSVPVSMAEVYVGIDHPGFKPAAEG